MSLRVAAQPLFHFIQHVELQQENSTTAPIRWSKQFHHHWTSRLKGGGEDKLQKPRKTKKVFPHHWSSSTDHHVNHLLVVRLLHADVPKRGRKSDCDAYLYHCDKWLKHFDSYLNDWLLPPAIHYCKNTSNNYCRYHGRLHLRLICRSMIQVCLVLNDIPPALRADALRLSL